ncbi:Maf-like protein [Thioalkalivibrio nitratireducens DSM 14787]|uniref:7-methyl-GTP pyrophosphatase n=1 Tax=Thioalkalivibrio nitratireducens (strain DSM 14787 / UNIQEM 213 / ALEN2) TaxID=1255043 RepID=L0DVN3_THIND|nr:Maf family nucleotide pyrophosphatase [Thioalkalivibrio nitratireducens]AGA33040.1 Maf-like protein [Thioalkalivibrio nitratireducens DSM 14787]
MAPARPLVLASTSSYRRALLQRLGLDFQTAAPGIDESPFPNEAPEAMVARLAAAKAADVARDHPAALVIGSDQCAAVNGRILGKPGSHERASEQLAALSGRRVVFYTGLCLIDSAGNRQWLETVPYAVEMRSLASEEIERYLRVDRPYDCAGSFRSEGLGIALFRRMEGEDPTALIGLPLIRLCDWLREAGLPIPPDAPSGRSAG